MFAGYLAERDGRRGRAIRGQIEPDAEDRVLAFARQSALGQVEEARIVKTDAAEEVTTLKQQPGKDLILWGSISLAQSLINRRLIDEYRLVICPIVLGKGRAIFGDEVSSRDLKLVEAKTMDLGTVALKYVER